MNMRLWEKFHELVFIVREDHAMTNALTGGGHDFSHALMTSQYCMQIEENPLTGEMAWVAAICHNTDRLFPDWSREDVETRVRHYLSFTNIRYEVRDAIVEAVLNHSGKNSETDKPITIILKDADKLANLGPLLALRSAQAFPSLPPINLKYLFEYPPGCSYRNPGSIFRDIESSLEWEQPGWFRKPKAIELAKPLFAQLRQINEAILQQFNDVGLMPYPFPEDFEPEQKA